MAQFRIEVKGIEALKRKLRQDVLVLPALSKGVRDLTLTAEREARLGAPRDIGTLQRNIVSEIKPLEGRVHIVGQARGYAPTMEFGRKAGAQMPPPDALASWARRHGFGTSRGALFVLARAIARRGIKGRFFFRRASEKVRAQMPAVVKEMRDRVQAIWGSR